MSDGAPSPTAKQAPRKAWRVENVPRGRAPVARRSDPLRLQRSEAVLLDVPRRSRGGGGKSVPTFRSGGRSPERGFPTPDLGQFNERLELERFRVSSWTPPGPSEGARAPSHMVHLSWTTVPPWRDLRGPLAGPGPLALGPFNPSSTFVSPVAHRPWLNSVLRFNSVLLRWWLPCTLLGPGVKADRAKSPLPPGPGGRGHLALAGCCQQVLPPSPRRRRAGAR